GVGKFLFGKFEAVGGGFQPPLQFCLLLFRRCLPGSSACHGGLDQFVRRTWSGIFTPWGFGFSISGHFGLRRFGGEAAGLSFGGLVGLGFFQARLVEFKAFAGVIGFAFFRFLFA